MTVYRRLVAWLFGAGTVNSPSLAIGGPTTGMFSPAANNIGFAALGGITFRIQAVASAVNYVQVQPAVTAGSPIVAAQGTDANISLTVAAKGTGTIRLQARNGTSFEVNASATPVNYLRATGVAAGGQPQLSAQGADTNITLQLASKGAAPVQTTAPFQLPGYTVATLPSAATYPRCMVYVSDGTTNKRLAISDGTNWRWPDGAVVS